ncbi:hypothetical protein QWY74_07310 [Halomonas almeriensis]|nr:hypothetical protein [Halomonas almeriensis]MDN3553269.1 hypothetical protein [Halomonas almeriensis]
MILTKAQLAYLTMILAPYRAEPITRPTIEIAVRMAKELAQ